MKKKFVVALVFLALCAAMVGAGTFAYFSNQATSTGNSFTAGTLNIEKGTFEWSAGFDNMKPGDTKVFTIPVNSVGSLPLDYTVTASLSGYLAGGANPCTYEIKIDGVTTSSDTLSAQGGDDSQDMITVYVTMPPAAGNEYQGQSGTLDLTINASQQK